jgi:hypothetical protein
MTLNEYESSYRTGNRTHRRDYLDARDSTGDSTGDRTGGGSHLQRVIFGNALIYVWGDTYIIHNASSRTHRRDLF